MRKVIAMKFVHIGKGHLVNDSRILAVVLPSTVSGRRYSRNAKEAGKYIDATMGKGLSALVLLDDGTVIGSTISTKTLLKRLNARIESEYEGQEDADDES